MAKSRGDGRASGKKGSAKSRNGGAARTPLQRFLEKCEFDAVTGCVLWRGGKTRGRGKTSWYGSFWYAGKRWAAHRWAALHIHGLHIEGLDVDHECGNTLCQAHLQAVESLENTALYWLRVEKGIEPAPAVTELEEGGVPFYIPPAWFEQRQAA